MSHPPVVNASKHANLHSPQTGSIWCFRKTSVRYALTMAKEARVGEAFEVKVTFSTDFSDGLKAFLDVEARVKAINCHEGKNDSKEGVVSKNRFVMEVM